MDHDKVVFLLIIVEADTDRCHKQRILFDAFLLKNDILHDFLATEGNTLRYDIQFLGKGLCIAVDLATTTNDKCRTNRLIAIQFADLVCYFCRHFLTHDLSQFPYFPCRYSMGDPHDVLIGHFV